MTDTRDAKRKPPFSYRPPEQLRAEFERRVAQSGLSVNAFLTEAWQGRNRHRPGELRLLSRILATCADIADMLRRSPPVGRDDTSSTGPDAIATQLTEIRSALFVLMGRKP